jgi:hypothetical protein
MQITSQYSHTVPLWTIVDLCGTNFAHRPQDMEPSIRHFRPEPRKERLIQENRRYIGMYKEDLFREHRNRKIDTG